MKSIKQSIFKSYNYLILLELKESPLYNKSKINNNKYLFLQCKGNSQELQWETYSSNIIFCPPMDLKRSPTNHLPLTRS